MTLKTFQELWADKILLLVMCTGMADQLTLFQLGEQIIPPTFLLPPSQIFKPSAVPGVSLNSLCRAKGILNKLKITAAYKLITYIGGYYQQKLESTLSDNNIWNFHKLSSMKKLLYFY